MKNKIRIDELVVNLGLAPDVATARKLVMAGEVRSGDHVWDKPGEQVSVSIELQVKTKGCRWVSRGGLKLEEAIKRFAIEVKDCECLDIGASTGGFTDVLLHFGAKKVVATDVGYGLLDARLQNDPRVVVIDRTNFRETTCDQLGGPFALIVTDVSFISLTKILVNASTMMQQNAAIIALIKPQFEAEKHLVPKGGIVVNPETHISVICSLKKTFAESGALFLHNLAPVPRVKAKKNIEFLSLWKTTACNEEPDVELIVNRAHHQDVNAF